MPDGLKKISPSTAYEKITDVDLSQLYAEGRRLVLLDVDNTLMHWGADEIPGDVRAWVQGGKALGVSFCILSNTNRPERLMRIAGSLGVEALRGKNKPSRQMYEQAMSDHGVEHDQTIMIGDQLLTDVLGANRTGIDAIWLRPLSKKEFLGTRLISRVVERVLGVMLADYFLPVKGEQKRSFFQSESARQFVKFLLVGGTSFVIDYSLTMTFWKGVYIQGARLGDTMGEAGLSAMPWLVGVGGATAREAGFRISKAIGAGTAIVFSFLLNRKWTFKISGKEDRSRQFVKFFTVAGTGMLLNVSLSSWFLQILPFDETNNGRIGIILATGMVAVWNFTGQKLFAFRKAHG
jgi:HAD superfamily phosphatase (TIGR01668 family)